MKVSAILSTLFTTAALLLATPHSANASGWAGSGYSSCSGCKVDTNQSELNQSVLAILVGGSNVQISLSAQTTLEAVRSQLTYRDLAEIYVRRIQESK